MVGEILYETQAIQDAMEGLGMSDYEDTSDEEEEARMTMLDVNQLSVISEESVTAVEQYFQKLLAVEEEKMSMKSYGTRDTSPRTTPRTSPTPSQHERHSNLGTSTAGSVGSVADHCVVKMESVDSTMTGESSEAFGKIESYDSAMTTESSDAFLKMESYGSALAAESSDAMEPLNISGNAVDRGGFYMRDLSDVSHTEESEDAPLVQSKKMGKVEKIGTTLKNTLQKLDFTKSKDKLDQDEALSAKSHDKTPLLTPATSREHLSVRKANQVADSSGPSAFHVVSPSRSREPSITGISRESSVDNVRGICSVPDTPECSGGQAISLRTITTNAATSQAKSTMSNSSIAEGCVLVSTDGKTYKMDDIPEDESFV